MDVDFLVQMMALSHGHSHPELRVRNTMELLEALDSLRLLKAADAAVLEDDYRFLSRLENRLRIESDQPAWAIPTSVTGLRPLARRMGFEGTDGAARMLAELSERRDRDPRNLRPLLHRRAGKGSLMPGAFAVVTCSQHFRLTFIATRLPTAGRTK